MSTLPLRDQIGDIRQEFPATGRMGYFNTGTIAPLPRSVLEAHQERERRYYLGGPLDPAYDQALREEYAAVRGKVAAILSAPTGRIALTENTTAGINAALLSQTWQPGDEIITSAAEHPAVILPLGYLQSKFGVVVRTAPVRGGVVDTGQLQEMGGPRTRAVVLSHVSFSTGGAYDIAAVCAWARECGLLTVIDGAQSAGAIPLDLPAMDPDYYAIPGYKWTMGPQGTAALYAAERVSTGEALPYRLGPRAVSKRGPDWAFVLHADARRYEGTATNAAVDFVAWGEALDYVDSLGRQDVYARLAGLCSQFKLGLQDMGGVELITPVDQARSAGLIVFRLPGFSAEKVAGDLSAQGLIIRTVAGDALRASFHLYNTEEEVAQLLDAIQAVLASGR